MKNFVLAIFCFVSLTFLILYITSIIHKGVARIHASIETVYERPLRFVPIEDAKWEEYIE